MVSLEQCRIKAVNRNLYLINVRYKVIKTITEVRMQVFSLHEMRNYLLNDFL
ncbi:uncharacterized protein Dvir_GJ21221 [Drosophila virilis]|uniref:Uncharacterized protein n=1 Tax=Drosophila virilis TaxID=7244 RepID=A0A0Q9WCR4_DROVI|nr:uncharacterized protein Dvir_GJ21221 [Drosophila virilis]